MIKRFNNFIDNLKTPGDWFVLFLLLAVAPIGVLVVSAVIIAFWAYLLAIGLVVGGLWFYSQRRKE